MSKGPIKKTSQKIKIITIGDAGVGKSSMISVLLGHDRQEVLAQGMTCGAQFDTVPIHIDRLFRDSDSKNSFLTLVNDEEPDFRLHIWDTSGQERFRAMTNIYFRQTDGVIMVFDVTRPDTFENLINYWIPNYEKVTGKNIQDTPCMIVANQIDKLDIEGQDGRYYAGLTAKLQNLADDINCSYMITSMVFENFSISQRNVLSIIQNISHRILQKYFQRQSVQFLKDHPDLIVLTSSCGEGSTNNDELSNQTKPKKKWWWCF